MFSEAGEEHKEEKFGKAVASKLVTTLHPWSSVGEVTAVTSQCWLPWGRTDPVSLQQQQHDCCENSRYKQEIIWFVTYLHQGMSLTEEPCLLEHCSSTL